MNKAFRDIYKKSDQFDPETMQGLATKELRKAPEYIRFIIESSIMSIPAELDIKFEGYKILNPIEEYNLFLAKKDTKLDITESNIYTDRLEFSYEGQSIFKNISLPFCTKGGILKLSNTDYSIVPVLADVVISPGNNNIFVSIVRDKFIYNYEVHEILVNGKLHYGKVINSKLYRIENKTDNLGSKIVPPTALYQLIYYGIDAMFEKYFNVKPILCRYTDLDNIPNIKDYNVYTSNGKKPSTLKTEGYHKNTIALLVPNTIKGTYVDNIATSIIYTLDVFPAKVEELLEVLDNKDLISETNLWKIMLGTIIFKGVPHVNKILTDMNKHISSLDGYNSYNVQEKLANKGYHINNFYDLQMLVIENFEKWIIEGKSFDSNYFEREIDINYYVLFEIFNSIVWCFIEITKRYNNLGVGAKLSFNEVEKIFHDKIKTGAIYRVTNSKGGNLSLRLLETVNGILPLTVTDGLELQESASDGVNRGKNAGSKLSAQFKNVRAADLLAGSIYGLKKSLVIALARLNPYIKVRNGGLVMEKGDTEFIALWNSLLKMMNKDTNITEELVDSSELSKLKEKNVD